MNILSNNITSLYFISLIYFFSFLFFKHFFLNSICAIVHICNRVIGKRLKATKIRCVVIIVHNLHSLNYKCLCVQEVSVQFIWLTISFTRWLYMVSSSNLLHHVKFAKWKLFINTSDDLSKLKLSDFWLHGIVTASRLSANSSICSGSAMYDSTIAVTRRLRLVRTLFSTKNHLW